MMIAGSQASAIAIIARWRMPPDSSCGYAFARALGIPTSSRSSPARLAAAAFERSRRSIIGSAIWSPTRWTGLRAFIAPWKMIEISRQRYRWRAFSDRVCRSIPNSRTLPATTSALDGRSRRSESAVVVLPQPDSPAIPRASPSSSVKLTSSTA